MMQFLKSIPTKVYLFGFFIMVGLGFVLYFLLGREAKSLVTSRILSRQEILARAEAGNIESFFQAFGNSVVLRAELPRVEKRSDETYDALDEFIEKWGSTGFVGGIALTDSKGIARYNSNELKARDPGASLADRDYFIWASSQAKDGEYFVGNPVVSKLGATKGKTIVPVASPVFQDDEFTGVLVAAVELNSLARGFTQVLKLSDATKVYLTNSDGELIHSDSDSLEIGLSIFESMPELEASFKAAEEGTLKVGNLLLGYSSADLGNQTWPIIISTPIEEVGSITIPIYIRLGILFGLLFATLFIFGLVTVNEVRKQERSKSTPV